MIDVSVQYKNKALEIAVYDITDTVGYYSGSIAVEYVYELDALACSDLSEYQFVGPVDESGFAFALRQISYEMSFSHQTSKPDTENALQDAIALIVKDLM